MIVAHLIERLTLGGATRSLMAMAAHSAATSGIEHRLVSLRPPHPAAADRAHALGLALFGPDDLAAQATDADVLHVHFWNTPELYAGLRRSLPPTRIVVTSHVGGVTAPHVLTGELVGFADRIIATSPHTLDAAGEALLAKACVIPSVTDFRRLREAAPAAHEGFTVGYVGTVDFAKMHPDFVAMHAALEIPGLRVIVCGDGGASKTLAAQIQSSGATERFEVRGYIEDLAPVLSELDVFGYPLCEDTYATTELVLHEAMYAGVPAVVLNHGGAAHTVRDGETGFVAASETDYRARIAWLHDHPEERRRMGLAAADFARTRLGPEHLLPPVERVYESLLKEPRRRRRLEPAANGADAWIRSLGPFAEPFRASLFGSTEADETIASLSPVMASADAGGLLHYRRAFPDDPALRFWSGLVLMRHGRPALAAAEFKGARSLGFDETRSATHLARALDVAGSARRSI